MTNPRSVPVKYEDLQHMDYLDRVIKETLRLFPVVPVIARRLTEDLRMGSFVNICICICAFIKSRVFFNIYAYVHLLSRAFLIILNRKNKN